MQDVDEDGGIVGDRHWTIVSSDGVVNECCANHAMIKL